MLSINALVLNFVLKYLIKPYQIFMPITPPVMIGLRKWLDVLSKMFFRTPSHIGLEPVAQEVEGGKVVGEWVVSSTVTNHDNAVLYLHGGGYFFGSPYTHRPISWRLSQKSRTRVFVLDYRLVPEHTVADCCDDAVNAYQWLLDEGYAPENLIIGGDSAGGGLTLLTLLALKDRGLPMPGAAFCLSPFADMSQTSPTFVSNYQRGHMFHRNALVQMEQYLIDQAGCDPRDPRVSPAFGDFTGVPPLFFQVADTEMLFHDTLLTAKNAKQAGVSVDVNVWHNLPHVFTIFSDVLPEGKQGIQQIADFVLAHQ